VEEGWGWEVSAAPAAVVVVVVVAVADEEGEDADDGKVAMSLCARVIVFIVGVRGSVGAARGGPAAAASAAALARITLSMLPRSTHRPMHVKKGSNNKVSHDLIVYVF